MRTEWLEVKHDDASFWAVLAAAELEGTGLGIDLLCNRLSPILN